MNQVRKHWVKHKCCANCRHLNNSGDDTYCMKYSFAVSKRNSTNRICDGYEPFIFPDIDSDTDIQKLFNYRKIDRLVEEE